MTQAQFTIGAEVSCTDGVCGEVRRVIVDPIARALTHLVVEPKHRHNSGRLVPVDLIDDTSGQLRMRCPMAEFEKLDPAEESNFVAGTEHPGYTPDQVLALPYYGLGGGLGGGVGMGGVWTQGQGQDQEGSHGPRRRIVTYDSVPPGEVQIRRGDHVHAADGEIGLVDGLVINPDDHHVTHVLLQEGHMLGRKEVAIPINAVASMQRGVHLAMTRQQVEDLPAVDVDRHAP